jgi:WD40 repeat protein
MAASRDFHTTTLLPNGKVLATGGLSESADPSVAELYDPNTGTWTTNATFRAPRSAHTATLLPSGGVLIAGGTNANGFTNQTEVYVIANGSFISSGPLITARYHHTGTLLPNGKALITGGYNAGALASEELYDPATGTNSTTGPLNAGRFDHAATLLPNGKVLITGGTNSGSVLSSAELYDPVTGTNTTIAPMTTGRFHHTSTLLANGKVLVAGGLGISGSVSNAEVFDPVSGTWTVTGSLNTPRYYHTATLLPNGKVLAVAGISNNIYLSNMELYDPATGLWTFAGTVFQGRAEHTATLLPNGKVLVAGGLQGGSSSLSGTVLYDPATGSSSSGASLFDPRYGHTATLLPNGKVMAAGGFDAGVFGGGTLDSVEIYDPTTKFWTYLGGAISPRYFHAAVVFPSGKALIIGGAIGSSPFQGEALYDGGLGFNAAWQPQITSATSPLSLNGTLAISGFGFRGIAEGSCGNSQDSATDYPLLQLLSVESERTVFLSYTNWSTNSFNSVPVWGFPPGYALATVFVNGIPSTGSVLNISVPVPTAPLLTGAKKLTNGSFQFGFTNAVGAVFGALATTNVGAALSNWTALGGVTEVSPGQFQFTDTQATNNAGRFYQIRSP